MRPPGRTPATASPVERTPVSDLRTLAQTYYDTVDTVPADVPPLFAPDAVYKRPGYPAFEGMDALVAFYTGERVIASGRHGITHLVPEESSRTVLVEGVFTGELKDGTAVRAPFADVLEFDEAGLIRRRQTYFDDTQV